MKVGDRYKPNNKNSLCNYIVITKVLAQTVYYDYYEKGSIKTQYPTSPIDIDALRKWGYKFNHKIKY